MDRVKESIRQFDTTLDELQQLYPENEQIWDFIGAVRDNVHRLNQALHKQPVIDYSAMHQDVAQEQEDGELYNESSIW